MLIVACQVCGKTRILPGTPDSDGLARATWTCPCCGAGQVIQLPVSSDARGGDLRKIVSGMSFGPECETGRKARAGG
ncbi:MAG: alcohol dehydrogenase [Synergistota bacterium]|nr:alcohol dehydrogenase [Synergistota bacterium]